MVCYMQVPDKGATGDKKQQLREILAQKSKIRQQKEKGGWPEGSGMYKMGLMNPQTANGQQQQYHISRQQITGNSN